MYLLAQIGLAITALISPIPAPETTITLTMQMQEIGAAMVGIDAQLVDRADETIIYGRCTSDESGLCVMEVNDTIAPEFVRGLLDLGISGGRTFIFERGKDQEIIIPFTEFGKVVGGVNHEPHPTIENFNPDEELTALPPQQEEATLVPTTEFVVVDPNQNSPTPTQVVLAEVKATPAEIAEVVETAIPSELVVDDERQTEPVSGRNWIVVSVLIVLFILVWGIGIVIYWRKTNAG